MPKTTLPILVLACGLLLTDCQSEPAEESHEPAADTIAFGPALSLADIEGTWNMQYVPVTGDTVVSFSQVQVTPDGWTLLLPERDPIRADVTASGDSLIVVEGPYESIRRPGTTVTLNSVYRLEGERLLGVVSARYVTGGADTLLVMLSEGTRAP